MASSSSEEDSQYVPSPIKKHKMGKAINEEVRIRIVNMYKTIIMNEPSISVRQIRKQISEILGVGERSIQTIITTYKETNTVAAPKQTRKKKSFRDLFDEFLKNAVRRHVHTIWFHREIPTVDKIHQAVTADDSLPSISRTNLFHFLKDLDFRYSKRSRNSAMTEKNEIVVWRRIYLENIKKYREEGRHIYFLNETWVDTTVRSHRDTFLKGLSTGAVNPSGKGKRFIVLHIGSEDGFLPGGLLCFESKKNTSYYHDEMNVDTFREWMERILPLLQPNSVIVMDNASYHSVKIDRAPTSNTRKVDIIRWLEDKGEVINQSMVIPQLLHIVKRLKPIHNKYVIDELVKAKNHTVLRLPPYHCELNPIELAWSSVKNHVRINNTTYKLPDVKNLLIEGITRVDVEMWKNFISHTKKEETKFYEVDNIIDEILSAEKSDDLTMTITGDTSSETDSDSE
uniref:Tc1-like transposase DDE domain-containing protein n=1 Tax=Schizaphis graminum TaxID=13262 RepID=A0A2S2PF27_SCHGA